jgi:hypothetical protein
MDLGSLYIVYIRLPTMTVSRIELFEYRCLVTAAHSGGGDKRQAGDSSIPVCGGEMSEGNVL